MWLAESYEFTEDFKRLTIKTRSGIAWSDGTPFSAEDVAYTLNTLRDLGPKVRWGVDVQQAVDKAAATDAEYGGDRFQDPVAAVLFLHDLQIRHRRLHRAEAHLRRAGLDDLQELRPGQEWPVTTGPWQVVDASPQQKVFDRRPSWWAADRKLAPLPAVERNIWLPFAGEQQAAQALITNQLDAGTGMQPATFPTVFRQNPKIITHTGQKPPYGYMDWWPISLYVNNERPPFDDKDVRWALSYYIDRQQLIEVGYLGANTPSKLPLPPYPPLLPYFDAVKDLLAKYDTNEFAPKKGDGLLAGKGFKKGGDGFWADGEGKRLAVNIIGFGAAGPAMGPVLVEMLKRHGVESEHGAAARFRRPLPEGRVRRRDLWPWRLGQRALCDIAALPGRLDRGARRASGQFCALEERRIRQAGRRGIRHRARRHQEADRDLAPGDGDLAAGTARHPAGAELPPHSVEHDLLEELADRENPYVNGAHWHLTFAMVLWNLQPA